MPSCCINPIVPQWVQEFLGQTRALFNNTTRIRASPDGGIVLRQGVCTSAMEAMCLCFINSWSQRLRLCREIAAALAACHAAGVLHRDLTSFNVMLADMLEPQSRAQEWALSWRDVVWDPAYHALDFRALACVLVTSFACMAARV